MSAPFLDYLVGTVKFIVFAITTLTMLIFPPLATVFSIATLINYRYRTKVIFCCIADFLIKTEELTDGNDKNEVWLESVHRVEGLMVLVMFGVCLDTIALAVEIKETKPHGVWIEGYKPIWRVARRAAGIGGGLCISFGVFKALLVVAFKLVSTLATTSPTITEACLKAK